MLLALAANSAKLNVRFRFSCGHIAEYCSYMIFELLSSFFSTINLKLMCKMSYLSFQAAHSILCIQGQVRAMREGFLSRSQWPSGILVSSRDHFNMSASNGNFCTFENVAFE